MAVNGRGTAGDARPGSARAGPRRSACPAGSAERFGPEGWIILALAALAILSRVYTTNSLAGEPTPDEFQFGVYARDLARAWAAGRDGALAMSLSEGRSIAVEAALLSFALPWDAITVGRTIQALLNALSVPMTYLIARRVGLTRGTAASAALLLLGVPEFQEFAWRFWTDSQATLLGLSYLAALLGVARRPSPLNALVALGALALLFASKESTAVVFAPLLPLALVVPFLRRCGSWRARVALVAVPAAAAGLAIGVLLSGAPPVQPLVEAGVLRKTIAAGPIILSSAAGAIPLVPRYFDQLTSFLGSRELSVALVWSFGVGYAWLLAHVLSGIAVPPRRPARVVSGVAALVLWAPLAFVGARALNGLGRPEAWATLAVAALLVAVVELGARDRAELEAAWGPALFGLLVAALVVERLVISANPRLGSGAALTFRTFMPIVPLAAILAGVGLGRLAMAIGGLHSSPGPARAAAILGLTLALLTFWTPLLGERLSPQPLLGRLATRGADTTKAEGLRTGLLAEAEGWLTANILPTDATVTGLPRELAWYADLGADGMRRLVDLGSQPRTQEERRAYLRPRVGPTGAFYVVDFNVAWPDPGSEPARQWRQTYEWLSTRPNLEVVYLRRDRFGYPVFYVIRNHGYALSYGYRDREQARAEALASAAP